MAVCGSVNRCGKPLRGTAGYRGEPTARALRGTAGDAGHQHLSDCNHLRETAGNRCGKPTAGNTCGGRGTPPTKCLILLAGDCGELSPFLPSPRGPLKGAPVGVGRGCARVGFPQSQRRGGREVARKALGEPAGPAKGAPPPRGFRCEPHPPAQPQCVSRRGRARPMINY